jgi:hypothetical protein
VAAALGFAAPAHALCAKVCCSSTIRLTKNGVLVTKLRHGTHAIRVRDASSMHNFHRQGYGVNRATGIAFVVRYWTVHFYRNRTYTYLCDAHPLTMCRTLRST